jgi:TAT (twin-arginine translocation) pathway signal sequence
MKSDEREESVKAIVSRRSFLAGSAALSAVSLTGNMEGQMTQTKTEPWGRILNGRVAVVTGAARGIGRAAAVALAHSGANVVGIDICAVVDPRSGVDPASRAELDQTGEMVKNEGVQWRGFVLDQRDLPALRIAAEKINAELSANSLLDVIGTVTARYIVGCA